MNKNKKKCHVLKKYKYAIMVLGMDRSGTSMTSNLVQKWARYDGDPCIYENDRSNPNGYFENPELERLLADAIEYMIQKKTLSSWSPSFNQNLLKIIEHEKYVNIFDKELKRVSDIGIPWCTKAPLFSVTKAIWENFIDDPVLVITVRNPYDTARSLLKHEHREENKINISINLLRWQHYLVRILQDTIKSERKYFICYENVIENPEIEITKLSYFLKQQQLPNSPDQQNAIQEMMEVIEPKLHRNNSSLSFDECNEATQAQKELYALLLEITKNQIVPKSIDFRKYQLTNQEIQFLEKHNIHILPTYGSWAFLRAIWFRFKKFIGL